MNEYQLFNKVTKEEVYIVGYSLRHAFESHKLNIEDWYIGSIIYLD